MIRVLAIVMALASVAAAQSVEVQFRTTLAPGQKPAVVVKPSAALKGVTIEVTRQDGTTFTATNGALPAGRSATVAFGDGKVSPATWKGKLVATFADGKVQQYNLDFTSRAGGELKLGYAREHLDLEGHVLEIQMSRPAGRAELTVIGEDGGELGKGEAMFAGEAPGTWVKIPWTQRAGNVLRIEVRATSVDDVTTVLKLVPWSVSVPHEEVTFESGKAEILPAEAKKLDASYQKIVEAIAVARRADTSLPVRLYIAGHTDTVGSAADNRKLSLERARAIANWFRERGLPLAVAYAGFGEEVPRVKTGDEADEPRNRRVDYIVGVEQPQIGRGVKASWYQTK